MENLLNIFVIINEFHLQYNLFMKNFFEGIAWLFEEILFIPFSVLRELELNSWLLSNSINWVFFITGFSAMIYWILKLNIFAKSGEEDKDTTAHSFL